MFRRPPALADWLLDRFGYARQNEPLAGDLLEEFRNGRSAGWYWRQTLAVIAKGVPRRLASLAPYLLAVTVGYALQFPVSHALWSLGFPREVRGSGWTKVGLWVLMQVAGGFGYGLVTAAAKDRLLGQSTARLGPMFRAAGSDRRQRSRILAVACYQSFSFGFWSYCLCAVIFSRFSQAEFVKYEATWFGLWVLGPTLLPARAARAAGVAEPAEDREPWLAIPQREPVLTVALPDGRAIRLERDRLAESIFVAADPELIRVTFGCGHSLDLLRRAVWLGGHKSHSHIAGRAENLTLAELAALIRQTARTAQMERALFESDRRASLRDRLNRSFWGDPV